MIRYVILGVSSIALHLLFLWLYNPWLANTTPKTYQLSTEDRDMIQIAVGGDTALTDAAQPMIDRNGYEYPLMATMDFFRRSDLGIVNLETAVAEKNTPFPLYKNYVYRMDPKGLDALKSAGIHVLSLANNHIKDHGTEGLIETIAEIQKRGLIGVGAGKNSDEAYRGALIEIHGIKIGMLSYLEDSFMDSLYMRGFALAGHPGCARMEFAQIKRDIKRLKELSDFLIILPHWGRNYTGVTFIQKLYAHFMIDQGADIILGSHPHITHPIETYKNKPIVYSLGNYAFGTPGRRWLKYGILAQLNLIKRGDRVKLKRLELHPIFVQNRKVHFRPHFVAGKDAKHFLSKLKRESKELGSDIKIVTNHAELEF